MRLYKNLAFAVVDCLHQIFNKGIYANKAVEQALKLDKRKGATDRRFIAETTYDIVRKKRLYTQLAGLNNTCSSSNLWKIFAVHCVLKQIELPDWSEIAKVSKEQVELDFANIYKVRKFRESVPDWIDLLGVKQLGEQVWTKEIAALNQQAEVVLRTNTLNINKKRLQKVLAQQGVQTSFIKGYKDALRLKERSNILNTEAFKKGYFEIQDASSQLVAPYLEVEPGMEVIDACAGSGGKTLHLASLMGNQGKITAIDIHESKLKKLKIRAYRNRVYNINTQVVNCKTGIKSLYDKADRVLIDVPCSGLGVLKRNPDYKWKLSPEHLNNLQSKQREILGRYSKTLKSGGLLVYATCSVLASENQENIKLFLNSEAGRYFTFIKDKKVLAHISGYDGFYMALLKRK
ncbi:MAG: RsmB/NOP family class I SAM-dependent RNA methyltransferase [Tenacibaculum sp.]